MGHLPEPLPETGDFRAETLARGVRIHAPGQAVVVADDGRTATIELAWEQLPQLRACLHQSEWIRDGAPGEAFHGVAFAFEVHSGSERLAVVPTMETAERLCALGHRCGLGGCFTRPIAGFVAPELAAAISDERERAADGRASEAERTWQLAVDSFMNRTPISLTTLFEGHVSAVIAGARVSALDAERRAFRVSASNEWIRVEAVRFACEGDGQRLMAAAGSMDDLSEEALARLLGEGG